jgi:hypothetical protein
MDKPKVKRLEIHTTLLMEEPAEWLVRVWRAGEGGEWKPAISSGP